MIYWHHLMGMVRLWVKCFLFQEKFKVADTFFQVIRLMLYAVLIGLWLKIVDFLVNKKRITIEAAQFIRHYRLNVFLCCMIYELFFVHNVLVLLFN